MKKYLLRYLTLVLLFVSTLSYAGQPLWTFTALTDTAVSVADGHTTTIQYLVTNQSTQTHTLAMKPITGITQDTVGAGICANPFTLDSQNPFCTLSLQVDGSTLPGNVTGGPVVCQQGSTLQCYQPDPASELNITKIDSATISLAGSPLTLTTNGSGNMTITNTSISETALNIAADFIGTALDGYVGQDASNCSTLAPLASCTLTFTAGSSAVSQTDFPIEGTNTNTVTGAIAISSPPHIIFVTTTTNNGALGGFSGANDKCNASNSGKPNSGFAAGYTYKALLNGNNATANGVSYYRPDGTTLIATATGGNLVGAGSLTNSISASSQSAWTGASVNCSSWTSTSGSGSIGAANSPSSTYWSASSTSCSTSSLHLYCVSQ